MKNSYTNHILNATNGSLMTPSVIVLPLVSVKNTMNNQEIELPRFFRSEIFPLK